MLALLLKKSLIELNCDRALVAKIHPFDLKDNINSLVFSSIFEELKNTEVPSVKEYVRNIPYKVLQLEFGGDKDHIVVGNKLDKHLITYDKCLSHLNKLNCEVIVNQLLYNEDYIWGILSFQYNLCPAYIKNKDIDYKYKELIKQYKEKIQLAASLYE